ncbi:MAG: porin family protein [Cytophagales bacterium]
MKKLVFALTIMSAAVFANSQEKKSSKSTESPHAIGLRIGLTTPTYLGGSDLPSGVTKGITTGFVAGLIYSYNFSETFSFQPELLFIQAGYSFNSESNGSKFTATANWGYVQVPLLAKARFGTDAFKFTLHAGPYIGFATGGKAKLKSEYSAADKAAGAVDSETESDIKVEKNGLAGIDFGAALGAGVNIGAGPGQFIVDVRFNIGFTDFINADPKPTDYKAQTNLIPSLSIGYLLPIGN